MPRIARIYAIGYPHHITQRGNNKEQVFFADEDREFYLKILKIYSQKYGLDIWCYCLMDNHVHLLVIPKQSDSLARGIGGTNLVYTQYINRTYKRSGRLWQNRFFSSIVEKESYLWGVMRYIESNPSRAGLPGKAEEYRWSSAQCHLTGKKDTLLSNEEITIVDPSKYKDFFYQTDNALNEHIRKNTCSGRPLGKLDFTMKLEKILDRTIVTRKAGRPKTKGTK